VLGEYAASPESTEPAARRKWFDAVTRAAAANNMTPFLWDNGGDFLDRKARVWRDDVVREIVTGGVGVRNSLADSSEDAREAVQWSSAGVFHRSGEAVGERGLVFLLNGNVVREVSGPKGVPLETPRDYRVTPTRDGKANVTLTKEFLGKYVSPYALPGVKAQLTVRFSAGASAQVSIVQWDVPTVQGGVKSSKAVAGKDLEIPVTWKGIAQVAAVKAVFKDGVFLADDWTKYLGPLQAGYAVSLQ
jgi:endoglucanase